MQPTSKNSWFDHVKYSAAILAGLSLPAITGCSAPENTEPAQTTAKVNKFNREIDPRLPDTPAKDLPVNLFMRIPSAAVTEEFVKANGFVADHSHDDSGKFRFGYMKRDSYSKLDADQKKEIVLLNDEVWSHFYFDRETLEMIPDLHPTKGAFEEYHNYEALKAEVEKLAAEHPQLATLHTAGQSVEGRELYYLKISDSPSVDEAEPKVLFIGNMHGDEVVGRESMIYLARHLLSNYDSDPRIKSLVDNAQIFILPSMNPDGFEHHRRFNANWDDLNRSFPDFTSDPRDLADNRPPEVQAIMKLHEENYFHLALNFHGGAVCVNIPWDTKPNYPESERFDEHPLVEQISHEYADANPTMKREHHGSFDHGVTFGYEWYEVDGGMQDWANRYRNSIHATVELSAIKWPRAETLPSYWDENRESMLNYLDRVRQGAHLEVVDEQGQAVTGLKVGASCSKREIEYPSNRIHRMTPSGEHTITISAPGYESQELKITASAFEGEFQKVVLKHTP